MMIDGGSGGYMTIFNLRWALEEIIKDYFENERFAILGFDSCLMSMLEIGYELKDVARTIIASEGNLPNAGWGYVPMFEKLISTLAEHTSEKMRDSSTSVKNAAKCLVEGFIEKQKKYAIGGRSVDLAAWDLDEVETVVAALSDLAVCLTEKLNLPKLKKDGTLSADDIFVYEELKKIILQSHIECQTFMHNQCVDLKDFCERLALECNCLAEHLTRAGIKSSAFEEIRTKSGEVVKAVGRCVLKSGFCGDEYQFSNGISLYFPWTGQAFAATHFKYRYLKFVRGEKSHQSETDAAQNANRAENEEQETGPGKSWDDFLFYYLFVVTMRRTRNNSQNFQTYFNNLIESPLSRENWALKTRENWSLGTRENWSLRTKENWSLHTRENWSLRTRENWSMKTREDTSSMSALGAQGTATIPAGSYTLWTVPSRTGWQLVVNRQTKQWGTEYDAKQDVARIPMTVNPPAANGPEQFQIAIEPTGANTGRLRLLWSDIDVSVPVTVKAESAAK